MQSKMWFRLYVVKCSLDLSVNIHDFRRMQTFVLIPIPVVMLLLNFVFLFSNDAMYKPLTLCTWWATSVPQYVLVQNGI